MNATEGANQPASDMNTLFVVLAKEAVWDVQVPGFIDRDGDTPRFTPIADNVYLAREQGYLRLDAGSGEGQLTMTLVDRVEVPRALQGEDDEFALASVGESFFADARSSFRLTGVRYALSLGSEPDRGTVRCAEFEFEKKFVVFADPMYHFGIRLEGVGAYDRWIASTGGSEAVGSIRECVWTVDRTV
ncbi:hypothetical protein [Streptomyces sp. NPDC088755]|uniref:hypothetical protein n=1 Tax=Streptomyces sp. NPDC088755 TaxID=3365888 RepID=UPI0037FB1663